MGHYLYRFRREAIADSMISAMREQLIQSLDDGGEDAPERLSSYWISGHAADFAIMAIDPDPAKVDGVHQQLMKKPHGADPGTGLVIHFDDRNQ